MQVLITWRIEGEINKTYFLRLRGIVLIIVEL